MNLHRVGKCPLLDALTRPLPLALIKPPSVPPFLKRRLPRYQYNEQCFLIFCALTVAELLKVFGSSVCESSFSSSLYKGDLCVSRKSLKSSFFTTFRMTRNAGLSSLRSQRRRRISLFFGAMLLMQSSLYKDQQKEEYSWNVSYPPFRCVGFLISLSKLFILKWKTLHN